MQFIYLEEVCARSTCSGKASMASGWVEGNPSFFHLCISSGTQKFPLQTLQQELQCHELGFPPRYPETIIKGIMKKCSLRELNVSKNPTKSWQNNWEKGIGSYSSPAGVRETFVASIFCSSISKKRSIC